MTAKTIACALLLAAPLAWYAQSPAGAAGGRGRGGRGGGISVTPPPLADFNDHAGSVRIFDGATLNGWDGDPKVWKVENGAIVGRSPAEKPVGTTFIIWRGGGARGGGTQPDPHWQIAGYQADFDYVNRFSGQLMDSSNARFILTPRGTVVVSGEGQPAKTLAYLGNYSELAGYVKINEWNQYEVIAKGNTLTHIINGHVMSITIDNDTKLRAMKGLIALQIEGNGGVTISYRSLWLKTLDRD